MHIGLGLSVIDQCVVFYVTMRDSSVIGQA